MRLPPPTFEAGVERMDADRHTRGWHLKELGAGRNREVGPVLVPKLGGTPAAYLWAVFRVGDDVAETRDGEGGG